MMAERVEIGPTTCALLGVRSDIQARTAIYGHLRFPTEFRRGYVGGRNPCSRSEYSELIRFVHKCYTVLTFVEQTNAFERIYPTPILA